MENLQLFNHQYEFITSMSSLQIDDQTIFSLPCVSDNNNNNLIGMDCGEQMKPAIGGNSVGDSKNCPMIYQENENEISNRSKKVFEPPLSMQRYTFVMDIVQKENSIKSITDLGSGNCRLMTLLKSIKHLEVCNFVEVNSTILDYEAHYNAQPLPWDFIFGRPNSLHDLIVNIYQGDMTAFDRRLQGSDAISLVEVIEHLNPDVLERMPKTIFGLYKPNLVVITTPNRDFNSLFFGDDKSRLRHWDHKFEWSRAEFQWWCSNVIHQYPDYCYELDGVGHLLPDSKDLGPCTQIAIFRRLNREVKHEMTEDTFMDTGEVGGSCPSDPLKLHSKYIYSGQKIKPPEPDLNPIDWSLAT